MISPNLFLSHLQVSVCILVFSVFALPIQSCNSDDRSQNEYVSLEERQQALSNAMLDYNAARLIAELDIIDSLSVSWGWTTEVISGGIVYEKVDVSNVQDNSSAVIEGDTVLWNVSVNLINGVKCFTLDSLQFVVGQANQPSGYEALALNTLRGDSVRALVPSLMGYGTKGVPGKIPPGALLVLNVRQF